MDKPQLEVLLTSLDHWMAFFTALVVLGVGGEFVVHILYSRASGRLISLQHAEEKSLQTQIAQLSETTADANKNAAEANERASLMALETESLRKQNLEIQRKISNRFLTTTEERTIYDGIKNFQGHPIQLTILGDSEAAAYGEAFATLFQKAGWAAQLKHVGMYMPPTYGIICRISTHPDLGVNAMLLSFQKAGLKLNVQSVPDQQNSWVDMLIALKPSI